jgi:DNA-nicking Smr family endonuclease
MSRGRRLSDEERALWSGFARLVKPLRGPEKSSEPPEATVEFKPVGTRPQRPRPPPQSKPVAKTLPLAPLGRRLRQRVARGREPIDARIDLHGRTQREAHSALLVFLQRAQADGARMVLIVTGKGGAGRERDADAERGVLRRQVPNWLALPEFRSLVLGFEPAHAGHGGEGALYVRLRRRQ